MRIESRAVDVKDGVVPLLRTLREHAIPMALATSTARPHTTTKLTRAGLVGFFETLVCGGETANGKPHPEPYLEAARRLGCDPRDCWALEDSNNGTRAAAAAGCVTFQVPDLVVPDADAGDRRVVNSLTDVHRILVDLLAHRGL